MKAQDLSASARKVQDALRARGFVFEVLELTVSTRTAKDAAQAVGCQVAQIVKSLVLRGAHTQRAYLVAVSGANRVDLSKVAQKVGERLKMAEAQFVRQTTGFAIGGVPPIGHAQVLPTLIDQDLLHHDIIWAAAGSPRALFKLTPQDLVQMTAGQVLAIS